MAVADSEARVTVKVADNGPGIPEADIEKVLESFVRLERSRGRHTGGTGLGPGIARNIARVHDGDLVLENRLRGGLAATLTLLR